MLLTAFIQNFIIMCVADRVHVLCCVMCSFPIAVLLLFFCSFIFIFFAAISLLVVRLEANKRVHYLQKVPFLNFLNNSMKI